jgi:hypothetical protein
MLHQPHVRTRQKLNQQVDIAVGSHLAARGRPKF